MKKGHDENKKVKEYVFRWRHFWQGWGGEWREMCVVVIAYRAFDRGYISLNYDRGGIPLSYNY